MGGRGNGLTVAPGQGQPLNIQQADPRASGIRSLGAPQLQPQPLNMPAGMMRQNGLHSMQAPMMQPRTGGMEMMPPGLLSPMQGRQPPRYPWQGPNEDYQNGGGDMGGGAGGY